jgi:hypothetical protein
VLEEAAKQNQEDDDDTTPPCPTEKEDDNTLPISNQDLPETLHSPLADVLKGRGFTIDSLQQPKDVEHLKKLGFHPVSKSPKFFRGEFQEKGMGIRSLTGKAFDVLPDDVGHEEAHFALELSSLLVQLMEPQKVLLASCLLKATNSRDKELSIFKATRVPVSSDAFKNIYIEGPNAIIPNLPHSVPTSPENSQHAYVGFVDVLANEMAKATEFSDFYYESAVIVENTKQKINDIASTRAAYELFCELKEAPSINQLNEKDKEFVVYLWFKEWQDDFDPNGTKANRNQAWINTKTTCPPVLDTKGKNTFFMALSSKGVDHEEIEHIFEAELEQLRKGVYLYHGGLKRIVKVKLGRLSTCVDRPERTSMFQIGDHNGTYSSYWRHAVKVHGQMEENHLPDCPYCRKKRLQQCCNNNVTMSGTAAASTVSGTSASSSTSPSTTASAS